MRRILPLLGVSFALITASASAQSIYGPGGLLLNPTADFAPKGRLSPAVLWIPSRDTAGQKNNLYSVGANYAATDRLEIGATYLKTAPGRGWGQPSIGGSVKYKLVGSGVGWKPDVAVGASVLGGGDLNARTAFLAARFTPLPKSKYPLHLHTGVLYADELYGTTRHDAALFFGADIALTPNLIAFAEYRQKLKAEDGGEPDIKAPNAIGVVLMPSDDYKVVLAYANNGQSTNNKLAIGVGFTLGSRRTTTTK
jgi:hypothetical protein